MKPTQVAPARIVAQRLAGPGLETPAQVVEWLTCVQAQDFGGACNSVALRTAQRSVQAVHQALNSASVVRSWPMRGTAHLVPARDLGWMLQLTSPRILASTQKRHEKLGRPLAMFDQAQEVAEQALKQRVSISREELAQLWEQAGLLQDAQDVYRCIFHLCQRAVLCLGPVVQGKQELVLLDKWVPDPHRLDPEQALVQWALRYFRSHGPAPATDFAWWTQLSAAQVKIALAGAREQLQCVTVDGVEFFMDPGLEERLDKWRRPARQVFLLPGFDEFVLGYGKRDHFLPPERMDELVPGRNGIFKAGIVHKGRIVGTWRHQGSGAKRRLEASLWEPEAGPDPEMLEKAYAAWPR